MLVIHVEGFYPLIEVLDHNLFHRKDTSSVPSANFMLVVPNYMLPECDLSFRGAIGATVPRGGAKAGVFFHSMVSVAA